jgi:copper chaperone
VSAGAAPITRTYGVTGLTCTHCVRAVRDEVGALDGVLAVDVELHAGDVSAVSVTSNVPLALDRLAAALDEAGDYRVA